MVQTQERRGNGKKCDKLKMNYIDTKKESRK